jgi:hypothetical protein
MGYRRLAFRIAQPPIAARGLIQKHKDMYRKFWSGQDCVVNHAVLTGSLQTVGISARVDDA